MLSVLVCSPELDTFNLVNTQPLSVIHHHRRTDINLVQLVVFFHNQILAEFYALSNCIYHLSIRLWHFLAGLLISLFTILLRILAISRRSALVKSSYLFRLFRIFFDILLFTEYTNKGRRSWKRIHGCRDSR